MIDAQLDNPRTSAPSASILWVMLFATVAAIAAIGVSFSTSNSRATLPTVAGTRSSADTTDRRLPLREIPATHAGPGSDVLVVFITGDGGWASIDNEVVSVLANHGASVVGLDSRAYLSKKKTPDELGRDVALVARRYTELWHRKRIVLAGYSRGADLMPFAANRLPAELRQRVVLIAMLGLAPRVGWEFHFEDLFRAVRRPGDLETLPELEKLRGTRMMCVYGNEESSSQCRDAPSGLMEK